jgi:hypothetical protein
MGTISNVVQHPLDSFPQMQIRVGELTQQGWGDTADYSHERDMKYGMTDLKVPAVVKF